MKVICPYCIATDDRPEGMEMVLHSEANIYYYCPRCDSRSPAYRKPNTLDIQEIHKMEGKAKVAAIMRFSPRLKPLTWDEATEDDYYLEIKGEDYIDIALLQGAFATNGKIMPCDNAHFKTHDNDDLKLLGVDYGKTWRCWSRRPSEAERDAAKWDDAEVKVEAEKKVEKEVKQVLLPLDERWQSSDNSVILVGTLEDDLRLDHETASGENIYAGTLLVKRVSETVDKLPVLFPEWLIKDDAPEASALIHVRGEVRSYKDHATGRSHTKVFAQDVRPTRATDVNNWVHLKGELCYVPTYKKTPTGKDICELVVKMYRGVNKYSRINCIVWGSAAQWASKLTIGQKVSIDGRLQSRDYQKLTQYSKYEKRTVVEVSVARIHREE